MLNDLINKLRAFAAIFALIVPLSLTACSEPAPAPAPTPDQAAAMTDEEKLAVAQDMLDAWTELDWERVYRLFGADGVLHNMMTDPTVGEAALRERIGGLADGLTRMDFVILNMGILNGDVVIERIDSFDFNDSTGDVPVTGVLTIEDGQVKEWREYYDRTALLTGLGMVEGPPPTPQADPRPKADGPATAVTPMTDAEKIAVAEDFLDAWRALDWDKAVSLIAENGIIYNVEPQAMVGRAGLRAHLDRVGPGLTRVDFIVRSIGVVNGVVMIERVDDFDYNGHTGKVPVFGSMAIENGVITTWSEYYDHAQMRRALGVE